MTKIRRTAALALGLTLAAFTVSGQAPPAMTWTPGEQYFRVNGVATLTPSTNPFGAVSADYTPQLVQAGINGEKVVRIHVAKYYNFITTTATPYDATWIANWEALFAEAAANGLQVLPVLDVWSNWNTTMSGWSSNIFNANSTSFNCVNFSDCGPADSPDDLLFDSVTQGKWLDLMEHLVDEWKDQPNIIGWEVFSELDLIEGYDAVAGCPVVDGTIVTAPCLVVQLFETAAARIRAIDPRPITASTAGVNDMPALWTSAFLDWGQLHPYAGFPPYHGNLDQLILDKVRLRGTQYGKPVFIGESGMDTLFGGNNQEALSLKPRAWVGINQAIWAGAVSGAMNARALWFEDGYNGGYDVCTHTELGLVHAAHPACADGNAATILTLTELYYAASQPVVAFLQGVDYQSFEPVPLTPASGNLAGGALGGPATVIGWVRDVLSVAPLVTNPELPDGSPNPAYNLADHWPWRPMTGEGVTVDMPGASQSDDWLVEFWDTTTGTIVSIIDADQDVNGDITFTLPDFDGSIAFKVRAAGPIVAMLEVTPGQPNDRIAFNRVRLPVAIISTSVANGDAEDFDATTVRPLSVTLDPGGAVPRAGRHDDFDADGDTDLELLFRTADLTLPCGRSLLTLNAETMTGRSVVAYGFVNVVGCPP